MLVVSAPIGGGFGGTRPGLPSPAAAQVVTPSTAEQHEQPADRAARDFLTPLLVSLVAAHGAAVRGSNGRYHVVFKLLLATRTSVPVELESLRVLDAAIGGKGFTLSGQELLLSGSLHGH